MVPLRVESLGPPQPSHDDAKEAGAPSKWRGREERGVCGRLQRSPTRGQKIGPTCDLEGATGDLRRSLQ